MTPTHQLAVITCVRKELSNSNVDAKQFLEVMQKTSILEILDMILNFEGSTEEQFYYMKLEALWILQNLAFLGEEELLNMFSSTLQVQDDVSDVADFLTGESAILVTISNLLTEKCAEQPSDIRTINLAIEFLCNCTL